MRIALVATIVISVVLGMWSCQAPTALTGSREASQALGITDGADGAKPPLKAVSSPVVSDKLVYFRDPNNKLHRLTWSASQGWFDWNMGYDVAPSYSSEILQKAMDNSTSSMVADLGYGLKVDNTYVGKEVHWYGADKKINYALPINDPATGSLCAVIYNYNYNGVKWIYHKTTELGKKEVIDVFIGVLNSSRSSRQELDANLRGVVNTGKAYLLSGVRVLNKARGQVVVDLDGSSVCENDARYGASVSAPLSRMISDDCNGNNITVETKKVSYNGQTLSFAETTLCFGKGTLVTTDKGLVAIEKLKVGDKVLSYNEATGEKGFKAVYKTFANKALRLAKVTINDETLEATETHPFRTANGQWVAAAKLEVGQSLVSANGAAAMVNKVSFEDRDCEVYNLEIADWYTYCVGKDALVVHNDCKVQNWISKNVRLKIEAIGGGGGYIVLKPDFGPDGCALTPRIDIMEIGGAEGVGGAFKFDAGVLSVDAKMDAKVGASLKLQGGQVLSREQFASAAAAVSSLAGVGLQVRKSSNPGTGETTFTMGNEIALFGLVGETLYKSHWDAGGFLYNESIQNLYFKVPLSNLEWNSSTGWTIKVKATGDFGK